MYKLKTKDIRYRYSWFNS